MQLCTRTRQFAAASASPSARTRVADSFKFWDSRRTAPKSGKKRSRLPGDDAVREEEPAKIDLDDYHGNMNREVFLQWFIDLCKTLQTKYGACLIKMDGARYHKTPVEPGPSLSWKKTTLQDWLTKHGIGFDPKLLKPELYKLAHTAAQTVRKLESVEIAKEHGHEVIFTPPYHPELQEIEIVWAVMKSIIRTKTAHTMKELAARIAQAYSLVPATAFKGAQTKVAQYEEAYYKLLDDGEEDGAVFCEDNSDESSSDDDDDD